jgi:hypothetical protein
MHKASSSSGVVALIAQPLRLATAASMIDSTVMRVEKAEMLRLLHAEPRPSAVCEFR